MRGLCVVFIEFWRGVPLITVLFFATYMLPLFLPGNWKIDALTRVLIGVVLFSAAYMAEVVRGGLQAIPRSQFEAAMALGLGYWRMTGLVIVPQALKLVIPGIVNSFISLFKDTTLVLIVAIFDLLGQLRAAFADPNWATPTTLFTGFAFAGMIYFVFCFAMSRYALVRGAAVEHRGSALGDQMDNDAHQKARHPHHPQRDRGRDRRREQVVRQLPRAARRRPHGHARRAHRDLRALRQRQIHAAALHQPDRETGSRAAWWSTAWN